MCSQVIVACFAIIIPNCFCITPYYAPYAPAPYAPAPYYGYAIHAAPKATVLHTPVAYAAATPVVHPDVEKIDPNPSYHFKYGVNDPSTGDYKTQEEYRKDGVVQGSYSVAEPDGTIRTVHYTADHIHGFNAVVDKHSAKAAVHSVPAPVHTVHAAPVVKYHAPYVPSYYHTPAVHALPASYPYAAPYPYHYHR